MACATAVVVYLLVGRFGGVPSPELGPPEGGGERTGNFRVGPREDRNGGGGRWQGIWTWGMQRNTLLL